jgi:hypothetical protein
MEKKGIDAFWLKIIAIIGMTSDHIGIVFGAQRFLDGIMPLGLKTALYTPGGLTFPIMAYLMIEGYHKTSDVKRYMKRLLIFALITQPFFMFALSMPTLNVLFTLLLGLLTLYLYDTVKKPSRFVWILIGLTLASVVCDWAIMGVLLIFGMRVVKDMKKRAAVPILILVGAVWFFSGIGVAMPLLFGNAEAALAQLPTIAFFVGSLCAIPLLWRYSGKLGPRVKYLFYVYYPAHLLVLGVIRSAITGQWLPW